MGFQFDSFSAFLSMGGYGFYVWLSYGISLLAIGFLIWQSKREITQTLQLSKKESVREAKLRENRADSLSDA